MSKDSPNLIYDKRKALGLSQRELAEAAGTSQQQIQRLETGVQATRIDLAIRIAGALKSSLHEVFPKLPKAKRSKKSTIARNSGEPTSSKEFLAAGINTDPRHWTVRVGFHDGREFDYDVSTSDKERISSIIWSRTFDFLVFNTGTKKVAINRTRINYVNFLFDVGTVDEPEITEPEEVVVNFIDSASSVRFEAEPDTLDADSDDTGRESQLQNLFFHIDGLSANEDEVLWFDDVDGERVYLRTQQILSLEVPLLCCEPALFRNYLEHLEESEGEANRNETVDDVGSS